MIFSLGDRERRFITHNNSLPLLLGPSDMMSCPGETGGAVSLLKAFFDYWALAWNPLIFQTPPHRMTTYSMSTYPLSWRSDCRLESASKVNSPDNPILGYSGDPRSSWSQQILPVSCLFLTSLSTVLRCTPKCCATSFTVEFFVASLSLHFFDHSLILPYWDNSSRDSKRQHTITSPFHNT